MKMSGSQKRITIMSSVVLILLLSPLIAMRFTDHVDWDVTDFVIFGAMLAIVCTIYELLARKTGSTVYRFAVGVALAAAFILVWVNGAVGIISTENDGANLMFGGLLAVVAIGSVIARFRSKS